MSAAADELHEKNKRVAELDVLCSWSLKFNVISVVPVAGYELFAQDEILRTILFLTWLALWIPGIVFAHQHNKVCNSLPELMEPDEIKELEAEVMRPMSKAVELGEREAVRDAGPAWVPSFWQEDQDAFLQGCPKDAGVYETFSYLGKPTPKGYAVLACNDCEVSEMSSLGSGVIKRVVDPCAEHFGRVNAESCGGLRVAVVRES